MAKKKRYLEEKKDLFNTELWAISNVLKISIKKMKNKNLIIIIVFTNLHVAIIKIFDPKVRPNRDAI